MITGKAIVAFLLVLTIEALGSPQVMFTLTSPNEQDSGWFGASVSNAGDVNNDGYDDIIVGAPEEDPGSSPWRAGRAYIFSGATGDTLLTLRSPNEESWGFFGWSVSGAGDLDGDGYDDVFVGANNEGRVYAFSGQTGDTLYTLVSPSGLDFSSFGYSVSLAGDVNQDGEGDVIVGANGEDPDSSPIGAGRAYVIDSSNAAVIHTLVSPNEEEHGQFGCVVSGAGDVNADGVDDLIVGAFKEDPGISPEDCGRAYVFDGASGSLLYTLSSPNEEPSGFFGQGAAGAGDVDNDGHDDVIVGARDESPGSSPLWAGRAYVFSGRTGMVLFTLSSPSDEYGGNFGLNVDSAGDLDRDGHADVIVSGHNESPGPSPTLAGRVHIFSGATGSLMFTLVSPNEEAGGQFGRAVSTAGDVNADGHLDIIIGAQGEDPGSSPYGAGRAHVFRTPLPLSGDVEDGNLVLRWFPCNGALAYWVFGAVNCPWFSPGTSPDYHHLLAVLPPDIATWSTSTGIADPDSNWTYIVVGVGAHEQEINRSDRFGEYDCQAEAPVPSLSPEFITRH